MPKVNEGDHLDRTISAGDWNSFIDMRDWWNKNVGEGQQQRKITQGDDDEGLIIIKNSSGADRRKGDILQVGAYLLDARRNDMPWHNGLLHDGKDSPFAVLLQPILADSMGYARISGYVIAYVNFTHASFPYCRPAPVGATSQDRARLHGGVLGPARVIDKPTGTGEKECSILLCEGRFEAWGYADDTVAVGVPGTVSIWEGTGGGADTLMDEEAEPINNSGVTAGDKVTLGLMNNVMFSIPVN